MPEEVKRVAKAVLQALAALHENEIVHTGMWEPQLQDVIPQTLTPEQMSNLTIYSSTMVTMKVALAV